jgi:hypothetical protein
MLIYIKFGSVYFMRSFFGFLSKGYPISINNIFNFKDFFFYLLFYSKFFIDKISPIGNFPRRGAHGRFSLFFDHIL